jgi:glucan exporter ATP-binding protein
MIKIYMRSLSILWRQPWMASGIAAASFIAAVISLLEPIFFGRVIDLLSKGQPQFFVLFVWGGLGLLNVAASVFMATMADRLAHRQRLTVLGEVFERVIALPMSFHAELGSGRVVRLILSGADQLGYLWLSFLREYMLSSLSILLLVPTALSMNWRLACLLLVLSSLFLVGNWVVLKKTSIGQAEVEAHHQDVFGRVGDVIGNVSVVQSYTRLSDEAEALRQMMTRLLNAQYPVLTWWGILTVFTRVASTLTMIAILLVGSWLNLKGEASVGEIVAMVGFSSLLISKVDQVASFFSRTAAQMPTLKNFFELWDSRGAAEDLPNAISLVDPKGAIEFDQVTYHYSAKGQGVVDLNFKVHAGQTIALVGPSGSGKSTTLALLQRLFDPQHGIIRLDGEDIRRYSVASLRHSIATVFQDSGLFNRSIAENIRIGRPNATDAEVEEAARQAHAHDFILAKPGGYQFLIGERGSLLSGGERQRIAIARAVLKSAPILIFDEATSALDNQTERDIQDAIAKLRRHRTTFVIAHRLSTIVAADHILVFEHGRIVESGTFAELKSHNGLFQRLLRAGGAHVESPHSHA